MDTDINSHADEAVMESYANIPLDDPKQYVRERLGTDYEIRNQWFFAILEDDHLTFHNESVMTAFSVRSRRKKKINFG